MTDSQLDPSTANVSYVHEVFGDFPDGEYVLRRAYYWYAPHGAEPAIDDPDFRRQHAEIDDDRWRELFTAAFDRGERDYIATLEIREQFQTWRALKSGRLPDRPPYNPLEAPNRRQWRRWHEFDSSKRWSDPA